MNGRVYPPIGQRERFQFCSIDVDATVRTYSRGCTVMRGEFILVRVPLDAEGNEIRSSLNADQVRFVEHNITPAEWAAAEGEQHGRKNVSGRTQAQKGPGRGRKSGGGHPRSD